MLAKRKFQEAEATLGPFHPDLTENLEALAKIYESYGETRVKSTFVCKIPLASFAA